MSEKLSEKKILTLEANSESEYEEDEIKYNDEDKGETCSWYWCIKCEDNFGWEYNHKQHEQKKKLTKKEWKCERCKPKVKSIYIYKARSKKQSYDLMRKDIDEEPYEEPYSLCNTCLFLHDDDYKGKCKSNYECRGVGDVEVYYGYDYENAKQLERAKRRDAEDNTVESPTKKQKVNVIDLTNTNNVIDLTNTKTDETDETDDETDRTNVVKMKKWNGWSEKTNEYWNEKKREIDAENDD